MHRKMEGEKEGRFRKERATEKERTKKRRERMFFFYSKQVMETAATVRVNQKPTAASDVKTETKP